MRVTSAMMSGSYYRNINRNMGRLNQLSEVCTTGRKFSKASQDPTNYIKETFYKKQESRISNYVSNINTVKSKFECAEGNMQEMNSILKDTGVNLLNALTGSLNDDNRNTLAEQLRDMQDNLLKTANFQFTENYIFGGSNIKTPPFSYDKATNKLTYNGLDVSDPAKLADLQALAGEKVFVDIGFVGADGAVTAENAMNISLSALNMLGYGTTTVDGKTIDNNVIVLLGDIANMLESASFDSKELQPYYDTFQKQQTTLLTSLSDIGSKTKLLENTSERLADLQISVTQSIANTSSTDYSTSIMEYKMQEIVCNVSMQLGASVIPNSLFDFLR